MNELVYGIFRKSNLDKLLDKINSKSNHKYSLVSDEEKKRYILTIKLKNRNDILPITEYVSILHIHIILLTLVKYIYYESEMDD